MKELEKPDSRYKAYRTVADETEAARLSELEIFEKHHFDFWLKELAHAGQMDPVDVLEAIAVATWFGEIEIRSDDGDSISYTLDKCYVGMTPLELLCHLFKWANLRPGEKVTDRRPQVNWRRTQETAKRLTDSKKFADRCETYLADEG